MTSIKKRPDGVWRARYRDAAGKEHARHFRRKTDAESWLDEVTASIVVGRYVDPRAGRVTFAAWFADWSARQVWADGTLIAARQAAGSTTFGDVRIRDLRRSHVEAWIKAMQTRGLEPTTIRTRVTYVRTALKAAVRDRAIPEDPADGVALPRARRREHTMAIPTPAQVGKALQAAPEWFAPFVAVCAFAGLRLGEAAGLQLGDVDFLRRRIEVRRQVQGESASTITVVPPKAGSERDVYVPEALTTLLARHVETLGTLGDDEWLLWTPDRIRYQRNSAGHQWRQVRDRVAGLEPFTLHSLRHFYASGLIASGCDVVTVQRAMGHSSATITLNTYSHLWPTAEDRTRAAAADLMEAATKPLADSVRTGATS